MSSSERRGSRDRDDDRRSTRSRDDDRGSSRGRDDDEDRGSARRGRDRDDSDRGSSRGGRGFEYRSRSADDTKRRASQGANDFDKILKDHIKMWKPNDGDNCIRILPPTWDGAKHFGHDIFVHYGVGPDRGSYLCLQKMKGEPDPIAEERDVARREEDEKYAKELDAKKRVLVYLIDRDHEKEGVQAWAMPWTVDRDIVKVSVDRQSGEVLPIDHPEEGFDIEFEKKGAQARTEYLGMAIARRSTPLGKSEWLDYAIDNPLPDQLQFFDYDHIAKAFNGAGAHKEKSRGGEDRPSSRDRDDDRRGGRGRDDDEQEERSSRSSRRTEPAKDESPTWESVHEMTVQELEDLIDQEKLDINPTEAKDDEDLADWICETMKLKKSERKTERRSTSRDDDGGDDSASRLRKMRERRE